MKPSISIIIPVYNVEKYLAKCLDTVLVDNSFTGQVICVNDGSTDGSLMILEEYAIKYANIEIISQPNAGLSAARNTGLRVAQGEYVLFLDSDDWIFSNTLQKIIDRVDGEDVLYFNAKKYYENTNTFDGDCAIEEMKQVEGQTYFEAVYNKQRNVPFVCVVGGIYNRQFLIDNNLWNEPGIYHEDNYFTPQVLLASKNVSSINECVYVYRIREGSITANMSEKHIKDLLFIARSLYTIYEQKGNVKDVFYADVCGIYTDLITSACINNIVLIGIWKMSDSRMMLKCAKDEHHRKIAKLTYMSHNMAYQYATDNLPSLWRRLINRFL